LQRHISVLEISYYFSLGVRYSKYCILDIILYFTLYIGYINKTQQNVSPNNISHISSISKSVKNPNILYILYYK